MDERVPSRAGRATPIGRLLVAIALALLVGVPVAQARDTLAPPGSSDHWLPREDWVERHWVPFDEYALRRELGLRGRDLEAYLFDDRRTLAALAGVKGIALVPLVDRLVEPMRAASSPELLALLRDGESTGRANPVEAQIMLARRRRDLPCWLARPVPGKDPSQPYTEQHRIRGRAAAVRSIRELRADERLIERYRRALPRTCWRVPPPWRGPRVAPQPPEPAARVARADVPRYSCELDRGRSA